MKVHLDCIPCFLRQALEAVKMSTNNDAVREKALREVVTYLSQVKWTTDIPRIGTEVHRIVKKVTGNSDPYKQLKNKYNKLAAQLYPKLEFMVKNSSDPLFTALKIAIAGNAIDFGPKAEINLEKEVKNALTNELAINHIESFRHELKPETDLLYLADNSGETFFDRILLEELTKFKTRIVYVVKGGPILNDATIDDAKIAQIDKIADVISTGTDCAGIIFDECSEEFIEAFKKSSIVISKGQGNYESLNEVKDKKIFFLLKVKCPIVGKKIGARVGSIVLKAVSS
ncbi:MAG TPA: DUF89 family protein [Candidatus Bathyarchaeota archaeon]|nr:DUF89 family protein [Candidatus Bathyarchaeota archaeon]HEX69591.1 DUF89 family protein [Candidatus Bathyarchaeota archaeon]